MIDNVYKVLQIILNKNNVGGLTQDRFNRLAQYAQLKIVNELPGDIYRARNKKSRTGLADILRPMENALNIFSEVNYIIKREVSTASPNGFTDFFRLPTDMLILDSVWYKKSNKLDELDKVGGRQVLENRSTAPTTQFPVYERQDNTLFIYPDSIGIDVSSGSGVITSNMSINYVRTPRNPNWTSRVIGNKAVFDPTSEVYQDFELPNYMFARIVIEMALLYGVRLKEPEVIKFANQEQADNFIKRNQN